MSENITCTAWANQNHVKSHYPPVIVSQLKPNYAIMDYSHCTFHQTYVKPQFFNNWHSDPMDTFTWGIKIKSAKSIGSPGQS